jgi:exonuclease III
MLESDLQFDPVLPPSTLEGQLTQSIFDLDYITKRKALNKKYGSGSRPRAPTASVCTWNTRSITPYPDKATIARHTAMTKSLVKLSQQTDFVCLQETNCNEFEGTTNAGVLGRMVPEGKAYYSNFVRHKAGVAIIVKKSLLHNHTIEVVPLPKALKGYALGLVVTPTDTALPPFSVFCIYLDSGPVSSRTS